MKKCHLYKPQQLEIERGLNENKHTLTMHDGTYAVNLREAGRGTSQKWDAVSSALRMILQTVKMWEEVEEDERKRESLRTMFEGIWHWFIDLENECDIVYTQVCQLWSQV